MTDTQKLEAIKAEIGRRITAYQKNFDKADNKIARLSTDGRMQSLKELQCFIATLDEQSEDCDTCTNYKGCATCENGELYEGKPAKFKKKLIIIMDSKEGDTKHICNKKSCPFFSKTEDGDMGILCKKLWATPPKGKSSLASLCNYYDVQNLTIAEAEGCETINQILKLSEQHPTDYTKSNEEKAKEIAIKWKAKGLPYNAIYDSCLEMAQWKDRQFKGEMIDKACKWLEKNVAEATGIDSYAITESFKKAMEG